MDYLDLHKKISDYGTAGYYLIESFLIRLLQIEAKNNQRELIRTSGNYKAPFDAIAPNGLGEIKERLSIEIVRSLNHKRIIDEFERYLKIDTEDRHSLLLISMSEISTVNKNFIERNFRNSTKIYLWGPEEIQLLINKNIKEAQALSSNLFQNRIKIAIESESQDWKKQREDLISSVRA